MMSKQDGILYSHSTCSININLQSRQIKKTSECIRIHIPNSVVLEISAGESTKQHHHLHNAASDFLGKKRHLH